MFCFVVCSLFLSFSFFLFLCLFFFFFFFFFFLSLFQVSKRILHDAFHLHTSDIGVYYAVV
ncbi:hypothetical protein N7455_002933 [Penicillium solitum]|uniref:uncharacterized protein n=1 Tax=Penicillium solitum TaxID=60172 RepID=UPI0032C4A870|nr:hypothetical protein N7455_002933 [Penicillium solitum]